MEENLVKISELETVDELFEGCCFPLVQLGETKRIEYSVLKEMLNRDLEFVKSVTELEERMSDFESKEDKQDESIKDLKTALRANYYTKTEIDNMVGNIESLLEVI